MTLSPHAAMGLSFLVPGAAHFALGRAVRGAIAFLTTVGMFVVGYVLVRDRIWYMELFKPFGVLRPLFDILPLNLLPEGLNAGCMILVSLFDKHLDLNAERMMRLPRAYEHIGLFLTGASGIVSCLWASDAFALASGRKFAGITPGTAALLSWLVPGSAHLRLGQKDKGLLVLGAIVLTWALGLSFAAGHAVDRPMMSAWWIGQVPFGGGALLATFTTAPLRLTELTGIPTHMELGVCLCTVAGLMNLVVIVDAYTLAEQQGAATSEAAA